MIKKTHKSGSTEWCHLCEHLAYYDTDVGYIKVYIK